MLRPYGATMNFENDQHHRRSIRLRGYDYTQDGAYFVTACAARKKPVFERIENGVMQLNVYGRIVEQCWQAIPEHYPHVVMDEYVIMPNHFHGILILVAHVGTQHAAPLHDAPHNVAPGSLGAIVRSLKSAATRRINIHRTERNLAPVLVWQRNYFERIIRDEKELNDTRRYILDNPLNWNTDAENPQNHSQP